MKKYLNSWTAAQLLLLAFSIAIYFVAWRDHSVPKMVFHKPVPHHPVIDTEVYASDLPDKSFGIWMTGESWISQKDSCGREELLEVTQVFYPIYEHSEINVR